MIQTSTYIQYLADVISTKKTNLALFKKRHKQTGTYYSPIVQKRIKEDEEYLDNLTYRMLWGSES